MARLAKDQIFQSVSDETQRLRRSILPVKVRQKVGKDLEGSRTRELKMLSQRKGVLCSGLLNDSGSMDDGAVGSQLCSGRVGGGKKGRLERKTMGCMWAVQAQDWAGSAVPVHAISFPLSQAQSTNTGQCRLAPNISLTRAQVDPL